MFKNITLKGFPQIDLEFLEEEYDTGDGCFYVEFYIGGLPEEYLDNNGEEQENIPCVKVKANLVGGELQRVDAIFEQDAEEISDEEFMEQNRLDPEDFKNLKKQIEKYGKEYVLDNWDEIMEYVADAHTPDYDPRY